MTVINPSPNNQVKRFYFPKKKIAHKTIETQETAAGQTEKNQARNQKKSRINKITAPSTRNTNP